MTRETSRGVADLLTTRQVVARHGLYEITDDPDRVDLDVVHRFLSRESYWRRGVSLEVVERSVEMSLPLSAHLPSATPSLVGFVRVVTDSVTHAWLDDLFVLREHQGRGLGSALMAAALSHPAVAQSSLQLLLTADAHELYVQHGFAPFPDPRALMFRHPGRPD